MHTCAPPSLMDGQTGLLSIRRIGVLFPPADSNPQHMCAHAHTHIHKHKCAHMLRCAYTHMKAHTHIHMHTNTHTCKHTCRHSRTAVSAPWQKLQGCIPLPPARIPHRLRAEEGPWGGAPHWGWGCWVAFLEVWALVGLGPGTKAERVEKMLGGASGRVTQGTSIEKESGPVLDEPT